MKPAFSPQRDQHKVEIIDVDDVEHDADRRVRPSSLRRDGKQVDAHVVVRPVGTEWRHRAAEAVVGVNAA